MVKWGFKPGRLAPKFAHLTLPNRVCVEDSGRITTENKVVDFKFLTLLHLMSGIVPRDG